MRYNHTTVKQKAKNPFLGFEDNTVDPNEDNNPVLDAECPEKAEEEHRDNEDKFEVAGEDVVESENAKESDYIAEGEVTNKINEIDNIAKEGETTSQVIEGLAAVATEMYKVIANNGKLSLSEQHAIRTAVATFEHAAPYLKDTKQIASLESCGIVGLEYSTSQASMEGVIDKLAESINNLSLNVDRLFKNGIGLARSMTPLIDKQINRARALQGSLNSARRDAGQKEVSGSFVKPLTVDGRAPDANTVLKTAAYTVQVTKEFVAPLAIVEATKYIREAQKNLKNSIDLDSIDKPSTLLSIFASMVGGPVEVIHDVYSRNKTLKQIKIDGTVSPKLFEYYPSIAKVATNGSNKNLDYKKSLSLFGNTEITVSQYKPTVSQDVRFHEVPAIKIETSGVSAKGNMQTLNPSQQKDVLSSALSILVDAAGYFKDYATRNEQCMKAYQAAYKDEVDVLRSNFTFEKSEARRALFGLFDHYTAIFWRGIFRKQAAYSIYARKTAKALIDLVEASSVAAQGTEKTNPSNEGLDLSNPFL